MRCLILIRTHTISIHALTRSATRNSSNQFMSTQIFQSTHSQGVRLWFIPYTYYTNSHFNPRTHKECDKLLFSKLASRPAFQSTHSQGVRPTATATFTCLGSFQSTHSQGVRRLHSSWMGRYLKYFNPRTHKECDMWLFLVNLLVFRISIHALTRSATAGASVEVVDQNDFNPRTHKECDGQGIDPANFKDSFQSTHSQGVRLHKIIYQLTLSKFQSTHSQGVRPDAGVPYPFAWLFQSTHSQGVRLLIISTSLVRLLNFNPRTHKECDGRVGCFKR